MKHSGGSFMLWECFAAAGPGKLVKVRGKMNATKERETMVENLMQSARELWHGRRIVFQQDSQPKHAVKATYEWQC